MMILVNTWYVLCTGIVPPVYLGKIQSIPGKIQPYRLEYQSTRRLL